VGDYYESNTIKNVIGRLRWLRDVWHDKLWTVLFGGLDPVIDGGKVGEKCAFVSVAGHPEDECPDDAVPYHGRARLMHQTPWESLGAYRLRIKDAWSSWGNMGPKTVTVDGETYGLRDTIRHYTNLPDLEIYDLANDNWLGGAGSGEDGTGTNWSRVAIVIPQPHDWEVPVVGPGLVVGPETLVGIDMTASELSNIRRSFRDHRPAHVIGIDIYVVFDATTPAALLADRSLTTEYVRIPLGPMPLVGYVNHGMVVGQGCIVGHEFT
jgi:hypothetical protein